MVSHMDSAMQRIFQIRCKKWILEYTFRSAQITFHHFQHTQRMIHIPVNALSLKMSQDIFHMFIDQLTERSLLYLDVLAKPPRNMMITS